MPVPSAITDLSQTAGSNSPAGSESPTTTDDYIRSLASFIATLRDGKGLTDPVTLASGATTDIGGQNSLAVEITGTTTITSFGTTYNGPRFLRFTGILTLTHNATTLNCPGGASITTAAGDTCIVEPNSTPNGWNVVQYQRASLAPGVATSATSATTATSATSATTATTATNIAGGGAGQVPYQSAAGTTAMLAAGTSSQVFVGGASAPAWQTARTIRQIVNNSSGAVATGTTTIPADDTIPQNTEGDEYLTLAITPQSSTSLLVIDVICYFAHSAGPAFTMALFQDSTASALTAAAFSDIPSTWAAPIQLRHVMNAGTTSATTFKVRAGSSSAGTTTLNGYGGSRMLGGVLTSRITITEYLP